MKTKGGNKETMSDDSEAWHLGYIEESRYDWDYHYDVDSDRCQSERHILPKLLNSIEAPKQRNEKAKIGDECRCPICGKKFVKKTYQQKFCGNKCKVKYHNKRQVYY